MEDITKKCDTYQLIKRALNSRDTYAELEVGVAVFIKHISSNSYICTYNSKTKHKYVVTFKENGFLFAKRVMSNGNLSSSLVCLATDFPSCRYELEVDDGYLDSLLLDTEYDAAKETKEIAKKKTKATSINNKNRLIFSEAQNAYAHLKAFNKGDIIWECETSFGNNITKYQVDTIEHYALDPKQMGYKMWNGRMSNVSHVFHIDEKFKTGVIVTLSVLETELSYANTKKVYFYNLTKNEKYKYYNECYYKVKPTKVEDIV